MELTLIQAELRGCVRCVDAGFLSEARPLVLGFIDAHSEQKKAKGPVRLASTQ